jgi:hypothetical protein
MSINKFKPFFPMLKASIGKNHFKCGKINCSCSRGILHSAHYLSYRHDGKTHTVHVPKTLVKEITELCTKWRRFNRKIENNSHQQIVKMLSSYKNKKKTS